MTTIISTRAAAVIALTISVLLAACGTGTPETMLTSGKEYLRKNDNKAAVIQFKNALQKDPNMAEARFLLGTALLDSGDLLGAEKELRRALELKHPTEQVVPPLGRALVLLGQHKKLIEEFSKVEMTTLEGRAQLQTSIGEAELALGNIDVARAAFAAALAAQHDYVPARVGQARIAAMSRDYEKALAITNSALETTAAYPEAWHLKGHILSAQGQTQPALVAYRKAVDVKGDFLPAHAAIVSLSLQQKDFDDAAKQMEAMKQIAPRHPQTLYLQALLAYRQKNLTAARDAIQHLLRGAPDNLAGLVLGAAIEFELKSYALAETYALKALQRAPAQLLARRVLVATYVRTGEAGKALDALRPVLQVVEKNPDMLALMGEAYMMNGESAQAEKYFAMAAALDPADNARRISHAISLVATGDTEKGLRELEQTAAVDTGIRGDLALISTHIQRREYNKALSAIAALEKKQPKSPVAHNLRGGVQLATKDPAGARRSFERAVELNPTYFPAIAHLARMDLGEKKMAAARQRIEAVVAKDPKHREALLALAELRASDGGSPAEVVALINKAVSAHPNDPVPRLSLIAYYVRTKEGQRAVLAAQEALAVLAHRPEILDAAGAAYRAAGDTNQAFSMYRKMASLQPGSVHPHLRMAEMHVSAGNKEQAFASLRTALALKPDLIEAQRAMIALHLDGSRLKEAVAIARQVQKQRPKQSIGYLFEGDIYATKNDWTEAARAYREGLKQSGSTDLAARVHNALFTGGNAAQAQQFATTWLKDHPKDEIFRIQLAQAAMARKDYATAAEHYHKLLELQPHNWVVLNNLAWTSAQLKGPKAIEYAERAHKLAPENPAVLDTLGTLLIQKGDAKRGLELLRKASALAPQSPDIRLNFADALLKAGQKAAAKTELDELLKLGEKFARHAEVKQLREGL